MEKSLNNILKNNQDIYEINVDKPDKRNKSSWKYTIIDPRWKSGEINGTKIKTVYLRRDGCFFMVYKSDEFPVYFIDRKRAMFRKNINKFINNTIEYNLYSNDISSKKNDPSFRITKNEMKSICIDNFIDLCYYYKEYSAIGIGYTRNIRNLIVMDIDVDCTKPDNQIELNKLLLTFAQYNSLPDFYIFNTESKHIQLQWLIQNLNYKTICNETLEKVRNELLKDQYINCEVDYRFTDFSKITQMGIDYRKYTNALCYIVEKKRKFGDKNFTFWKAKNPMSALYGYYGLELKMPYFQNGEIKYFTHDEMVSFFNTKESRKNYFDEAPDITDIYKRTSELISPLLKKVSEKKVIKIEDGEEFTEKKTKHNNNEESRNNFVLACTRTTTWEIAGKYGYRNYKYLRKLNPIIQDNFKNEVYKTVFERFKEEDNRYNGIWPGTINKSIYSLSEFDTTFNYSFNWAVQYIKTSSFSNEDREKSLGTRQKKMNIKIVIVNYFRIKFNNISRDELHKLVNEELKKNNFDSLPLGSLKRYITNLNEMSDEEKENLYNNYVKKP